jgi:hypothetical protein
MVKAWVLPDPAEAETTVTDGNVSSEESNKEELIVVR